MSLSTIKPVSCCLPPAAGANATHSKLSKVIMLNKQAVHPLQVREKEKSLLQETCSSSSRREMMYLTAASLGFLSLLLPASAEARPKNTTMRQKIMEKFQQLREKAGLSKPKVEEESKVEDKKLKSENETGEKKPKGELSIPGLANIFNDKTSEET